MNNPMIMNSNTYPVAASTTSASATLTDGDKASVSVIVFNNTTSPVFVASSNGAKTLTFPTSGHSGGAIVGPNLTATYTKDVTEDTLSAILPSGATSGNVFFQVGGGA